MFKKIVFDPALSCLDLWHISKQDVTDNNNQLNQLSYSYKLWDCALWDS